jgi:hypothetical protein
MGFRIQCLYIYAADPARIASFWESALGWRPTWEKEGQACLEPPEGSPEDGIAPDLIFLRVPEAKTVKNRLYLDLRPAEQSAEVARLEAPGARQVSAGWGDVSWVVMAARMAASSMCSSRWPGTSCLPGTTLSAAASRQVLVPGPYHQLSALTSPGGTHQQKSSHVTLLQSHTISLC